MPPIKNIIIKVFPAVLFIGICGFGFFYIFNSIQTLNQGSALLQEQIQSEKNRRDNISNLNTQIKNIAPQRETLESHFAKDSDVVPFLDNLQALSVKAGAPAEVSSVGLSSEGGHLEVSLKAKGDFSALHRLIALLENSPYELDFTEISLSQQPQTPDEIKSGKKTFWNLSVSLTLISFTSIAPVTPAQ